MNIKSHYYYETMGINPTQSSGLPEPKPDEISPNENSSQLGPHQISQIRKKSPLFAVANLIGKVAKVVFTAAFAIPIGVTLLASKKTYSFGSIGGKADQLATKVRNFFVGFFHEKISGKLFGDVKVAKAELALKSVYHAFIKKYDLTDYKSQLSTLLNFTLHLTFSQEDSKSTHKEPLIEWVLTLPTALREKLLEDDKMFEKLLNRQFEPPEFNKLKESSQYSSSLSKEINKKAKGGQPVSLKVLIDFTKNMGLAFYFRDDEEKLKKYKDLAFYQLTKVDPETNSNLIEGLSNCVDNYKKSIFNSEHNIFSLKELTHIQDGFRAAKFIGTLIQNHSRQLGVDNIKRLKEIAGKIFLCSFFRSKPDFFLKNQNDIVKLVLSLNCSTKLIHDLQNYLFSHDVIEKTTLSLKSQYYNLMPALKSLDEFSSKKSDKTEVDQAILEALKDFLQKNVYFQENELNLEEGAFRQNKAKLGNMKLEFFKELEKLPKHKKPLSDSTYEFLIKILTENRLITSEEIDDLKMAVATDRPSSKKKNSVSFNIPFKKNYLVTFEKEKNEISSLVNQATKDPNSSSNRELINTLKEKITLFQRWCDAELTKDQVKTLLTRTDGKSPFTENEIEEIVTFVYRPKKDFESRYIADLNQIAQIVNDENPAGLIPQLQVVMRELQECCYSKLEEEEIKELLKNKEGNSAFDDKQINQIIEFLR